MHRISAIALVCCLLGGGLPPVQASSPDGARNAAALRLAQQDGPSLGEAVEQVRRQYRGRIVSATTQVRGNREIHIIKVLTDDGKVVTVRVAGRSRAERL